MHSTKPSHQAHNNFNLPNHPIQYIGITSLALLSLMTLALVFPFVSNNSSATTYPIDTNQSIAVALDEEAVMDITPSSTGTKGSSTTRLKVSSNRSSGYKVYLSTMDSTNAMVNVSDSTKPSIQALPMSSTKADFAANTWGYALTTTEANDSTTFSAVPTTSTMVADRPAKDEDNLYLTFAASIDTSLPAGQYANSVLVSVVANPLAITDLTNMVYMQDMQPEFCANTKGANGLATITPGNEVTKQLIDSRDGKEYWVAKLADGNCWMTQNLALDLNSSKALTSSDTDLNSKNSWTPTNSTIVSETLTFPSDATNVNSTYSWDLGEWVTATPASTSICTVPGASQGDSILPGSPLDECNRIYNVTGWKPTYSVDVGQIDGYSGYVSLDTSRKIYDAHYLVGNYYQWRAVTAESTKTNTNSPPASAQDSSLLLVASDSICPKGWRLPTSGYDAQGRPHKLDMSFNTLLAAYGYPKAEQYPEIHNGTPMATLLTGAYQNVGLPPMSFARSGRIDPDRGTLNSLGHMGFYYSSVASTSVNYLSVFRIVSTEVYPAFIMASYVGLPIRCLAR